MTMPYALFDHDEKLSRAFATEQEAWHCAEDAGLLWKPGELEDGYVIRPCPPDPPADREAAADWINPHDLTPRDLMPEAAKERAESEPRATMDGDNMPIPDEAAMTDQPGDAPVKETPDEAQRLRTNEAPSIAPKATYARATR